MEKQTPNARKYSIQRDPNASGNVCQFLYGFRLKGKLKMLRCITVLRLAYSSFAERKRFLRNLPSSATRTLTFLLYSGFGAI